MIKADYIWSFINQEVRPGEKPTQEELNQYNTLAHQTALDSLIQSKTKEIQSKIIKIANKIEGVISFYPENSNFQEWFFEDINTLEGFQSYSDEIHDILTSINEKDTQVDSILKKLDSIKDLEVEYTTITLDMVEQAEQKPQLQPKLEKVRSKTRRTRTKLTPNWSKAFSVNVNGKDLTLTQYIKLQRKTAAFILRSSNHEIQSIDSAVMDMDRLTDSLDYIVKNYLQIYNLELSELGINKFPSGPTGPNKVLKAGFVILFNGSVSISF